MAGIGDFQGKPAPMHYNLYYKYPVLHVKRSGVEVSAAEGNNFCKGEKENDYSLLGCAGFHPRFRQGVFDVRRGYHLPGNQDRQ